jgi:hypothetical protein
MYDATKTELDATTPYSKYSFKVSKESVKNARNNLYAR